MPSMEIGSKRATKETGWKPTGAWWCLTLLLASDDPAGACDGEVLAADSDGHVTGEPMAVETVTISDCDSQLLTAGWL